MRTGDIDMIVNMMQSHGTYEKKGSLMQKITRYAAYPQEYPLKIILDPAGALLAAFVIRSAKHTENVMVIPFLRARKGPSASTLIRKIIWQCIQDANNNGLGMIRMTDPGASEDVAAALDYFRFFRSNGIWVKMVIRAIAEAKVLAERIESISRSTTIDPEQIQAWIDVLCDPRKMKVPELVSEQEHALWPAKILNTSVPNYIIPIQPSWAQELFDERLSAQGLFPRKNELAVNVEGVYYSAKINRLISAPARILWYISQVRERCMTQSVSERVHVSKKLILIR